MLGPGRWASLVLGAWLLFPGVSSAELVFFSSGRTMSVKAYRLEGDTIVLVLRAGGEIVCPQDLVVRIAPDEVPYPEPEEIAAAAKAVAAASQFVTRYADLIDSTAAAHGVEPRLVKALIQVESAYQPRATSRKGAMGLMQLMPETARRLSVADPYDPRANIEGGVRHLKALLDRYEISLALAAYNAGEAAVEKFRGIPPYPETRNYVRDVMRLAGLAAAGTR
jgi:soluble lytic murein transglycosylase-like protein